MKTTKHRRAPIGIVALAIGAFALPAFAFQPLVTDDTGTEGEGADEIEVSIDGDRTKEAGETTRTRTLPFTYTRGITDTLDTYAAISHIRISSQGARTSGVGNPVLGAKWRFFDSEASKTSFALRPEVLLPVSESREARGLGNGKTSWALTLLATQEVGFGAIHANLGIGRNRFRDPAAPNSTVIAASIAPVWDVAPKWKLALDVGYESEKAGGVTTRSRFAEIGAIYSPNDGLEFALGVIRGWNSANSRVTSSSATVGVTWHFP